MPLFRVLAPEIAISPLETVYLEDRFSFLAFLLPPVWALVHRLWLEALGWLVVTVALGGLALLIGDATANGLYFLFALWIGFAAPALRAANLRRRGFRDMGYVGAADEIAAEQLVLARSAS